MHTVVALQIHEFKLVPTGSGRGVACDVGGAFIGPVPLLKRVQANGKDVWQPRAGDELSEELGSHWGLPIDVSSKGKGLASVARALNDGDVPRARLVMLRLKFPAPP
jgi:hypothetical protein